MRFYIVTDLLLYLNIFALISGPTRAEDVARAKRKFDALDVSSNGQCITLGYAKHRAIKKTFLGPVLKQRFLGTEFGDS
jgi:hypothetical protein